MQLRLAAILALGAAFSFGERASAVEAMTKDQIAGVIRIDALTLPMPGEFFAAVDDEGKPNWTQMYNARPVVTGDSRAQLALVLGTLVADGYLAVEAQDSQAVKNIGKEIISLCKKLNVSQSVLGRGNSLNDFAENNDWSALREELEATQNEVKLAMSEQKDQSLIILVSLGAWVRGMEVVSAQIEKNYTPGSAKLLRQPAIISFLLTQIDKLPSGLKDDPLVQSTRAGLAQAKKLVDTDPSQAPSDQAVKDLRKTTAGMVKEITQGAKE